MKQQEGINRRQLVLATAGASLAAAAHAQAPRSARVVKIVVGFPPGQATDIVARLLADQLKTVTGDNYIVENKPGQGGSIAMGQVAKSPADGSVMMLTHMSAVAATPHMYKSVPYDAQKDFEAISLLGDLPFVLVSHPSMPFGNVTELVRYAKAHPGRLTHASSGNGTVSHLAMEAFKRRAGIDMLHVPYRGSAPGLTDVVAGQVTLALETAAAVRPFVHGGQLKALGAGTPQRLAAFPNVPAIAEQGFEGFSASTWLMAIYPANTDKAMVGAMHEALIKSMRTPEVEARMLQIGAIPRFSASPAEASAYMRSEYAHWGEVVRQSGVKLD